jgi:uncharacterized RDD family membrane protein YckC
VRLFKKRIKAQVLDFIFISIVLVPMQVFLPNQYILLAIFVLLYICRDLLFRNASFGKKIQGLIVVDKKGNVPSFKALVLRNIPSILLLAYEFIQIKNYSLRIGDELANTCVIIKEKNITRESE